MNKPKTRRSLHNLIGFDLFSNSTPSTKNIVTIAVFSRLLIILIQFTSNELIPDHNAGVYKYPIDEEVTTTKYDSLIHRLLGGFIRWDAHYFMHISLYGYTYENSLAFFPLLPTIVSFLSNILQQSVSCLNIYSITLLVYIVLNMFLFVRTALILFELTSNLFNPARAMICVKLFCFNPASIFFSAPYTETLFSFLTFSAILECTKIKFVHNRLNYPSIFKACFYIAASTATRSNGLLNVGFFAYFYVKVLLDNVMRESIKLDKNMFTKYSCLFMILIITCVLPFVIIQFYGYFLFCKVFNPSKYLPNFLLEYGFFNQFLIKGLQGDQAWCKFNIIPLPYSYVQKIYWNVGFLKYFHIKQLPNFLLAVPIVYIVIINTLYFVKNHKGYLIHLGVFKEVYAKIRENFNISMRTKKNKRLRNYDSIFVCVAHAFSLTIFCVFCIHVQVTTRMLFSASPAVYWFSSKMNKPFIQTYYLTYFILGTIMFSNHLPWT